MEAHELVRVQPVAARAVSTVHQRDAHLRAWSTSASTNAMPVAPAPTTR